MTRTTLTDAYLDSLPDGLRSHPQCVTKGTILQTYWESHEDAPLLGQPFRERTGVDPATVVKTAWLPTVYVNVFELLLADHLGSDAEFLRTTRRANERLLSSRIYRAVVSVVSTAALVRGASIRWKRFHRCAPLTGRAQGSSARLYLGYPQGLYTELLAREKGVVLQVAVESSGARDVQLSVDHSPTVTRYDMTWR